MTDEMLPTGTNSEDPNSRKSELEGTGERDFDSSAPNAPEAFTPPGPSAGGEADDDGQQSGFPLEQPPHRAEQAQPEASWLGEDDIIANPVPSVRKRAPGPGLPESLAWCFGVLLVQIFVSMALVFVLVISDVVAVAPNDVQQYLDNMQDSAYFEEFLAGHLLELTSVTMLVITLFVLGAARLRLGRDARSRLGMSRLFAGHAALIATLVFPMMILCNEIPRVAYPVWKSLVSRFPMLSFLDDMNAMEMLPDLVNQGPLIVPIVIVAVFPALWEEFLFRGVIGRGLVARWGLVTGVLITSFLFAAVHLHPVHAVGVIPLGIMMHVVYFATRSIWGPILYHFSNNALAVVLTRLAPTAPEGATVETPVLEPLVLLAAFLSVATLLPLLWKLRTRFRQPDGVDWSPGYTAFEAPPPGVVVQRTRDRASIGSLLLAGIALAELAAAIIVTWPTV
jgi:hypothetical protein